MRKILMLIFLFCFMAAGPPAFPAEYTADTYNPKYEGAKALNPVSMPPRDVPENGVSYLFDTSIPNLDLMIKGIRNEYGGQLDTMAPIIVDGEWKGVQYWVESVKSSSTSNARYRTKHLTFQIGKFKAIDSYDRYRTEAPSYLPAGGKWYDMAYITDDHIKKMFRAYYPDRYKNEIEPLFTSETYLYTGAVIEIVQGYNDDHVAWIDAHSQCKTLGGKYVPDSVESMETRWQKVIIGGEAPDFYPAPEGSTEWKESYKECAAIYTGEPGTEITFPVNLYNIGKKEKTNFKAVWEGQGDDPVFGWEGSNPPWQVSEVEIDKGGSKSFNITVTVPDKAVKLFFKSNTDGKTPVTESNTDNNIMAIVVQPDGIDLAVTTENNSYSEVPGVPVKVKVEFDFSRLDTQTMPIDAVFTWTGAATGSQTLTVYSDEALDLALADTTTDDEWNAVYDKAFENSFYYVYFTGYANNTYTVTGTIMPTEGTDIDLSNNTATATIVIYPNAVGTDIPDIEIEPEIIVNLTG